MEPKTRNRILIAAAALLLAVLLIMQYLQNSTKKLEVYFFDAGKADAILLTTRNSAVLIDTGEKGLDTEIIQKLNSCGHKKLDCMIITHFDRDHAGSAAGLIKAIKVDTLIHNDIPGQGSEYNKIMKALAKHETGHFSPDLEYSFTLDGVVYTVYPPGKSEYAGDLSNNNSLIVRARYGGSDFLFMADAGGERLQEFINTGIEHCDVIKLPHHGSWQDLLRPLIEISGAKAAVITCSDEKPESSKTTGLLSGKDINTYLTRVSAVRAVSDGRSITIEYDR